MMIQKTETTLGRKATAFLRFSNYPLNIYLFIKQELLGSNLWESNISMAWQVTIPWLLDQILLM